MKNSSRTITVFAALIVLAPLFASAIEPMPTRPVLLSHSADDVSQKNDRQPEAPLALVVDDGTAEDSIGDGGQFMWFNRFTPNPADYPIQITQIDVAFGTTLVTVGDPIELFVYEDTDGDGDPGTGANLLATYSDVLQYNDLATFSTYTLVPPVVLNGPSGDILIGVVNRYGYEGFEDFPAGIDQDGSFERSWAATWVTGDVPVNPTLPGDEQWGTIDSFGLPGNWLVRAYGETGVPVELMTLTAE